MKRLEDIEKLSVSDLERIAQDESIRVPSMLKHDISIMARTLEMASKDDEEETPKVQLKKRIALFSCSAAAVAVIAVALSLSFRNAPKDTFEDPRMAYVQMEQVFGFISDKMNTGMDIAYAAEPVLDKTINALR